MAGPKQISRHRDCLFVAQASKYEENAVQRDIPRFRGDLSVLENRCVGGVHKFVC